MAKTTNTPDPGPAAPRGFIDAALMERAIRLRREGRTMEQIGADLGVKATAYLAKKIKQHYGADALARPATQGTPQATPAAGASAPAAQPSTAKKPARRRTRKPATAEEA